MPTFDWQLIVALLAVAAAAAFLIRRTLRLFQAENKSGRACNSCAACPAAPNSSAHSSASFIPLESRSPKSNDGTSAADKQKKTHPTSN